MRSLLPAATLLLFALWSGSFFYGAGALATFAGHLVLIAAAAWALRDRDPLRLGRGWWLPVLLWAAVALGVWRSPVGRAGLLVVALLPAFLLFPAAAARCWEGRSAVRLGLRGVAVVVGACAVAALAGMAIQGTPRAAQPLGHHLLLALWLATLLPLAAVEPLLGEGRQRAAAAVGGAGGRTAGPQGRLGWLWWLPTLLAALALLATRSAAGCAGALVGAAVLLPARRRGWLIPLALVAALPFVTRLREAGLGGDPSLAARTVYWQAALRGWAERPLLGWGAGSTGWTIGRHLRPQPGVNPPGEVVGDLHSLPAQLLYELGAPAAVLAVAVALTFVWRRRREPLAGERAVVRRAALAGLAGSGAALLVTPTLATGAPWLALAVAAGAALAAGADGGTAPVAGSGPPGSEAPPGWARRAGWLYAAAALAVVGRLDLAQLHHDRALAAASAARGTAASAAAARAELARAIALDPAHPLYRARLGLLLPADSGERAGNLAIASDAAPGAAFLALPAAVAALDAGHPAAPELLARACADDPLSGRAPFAAALAAPEAPAAATLAARALLAEPQLGAAVEWERTPYRHLLRDALRVLQGWQGVDGGLRGSLARAIAGAPRGGPVARLVWSFDGRADVSPSLLVFRRRPWPVTVASVLVRRDAARELAALPSAAAMTTSEAAAFPPRCDASRLRSPG